MPDLPLSGPRKTAALPSPDAAGCFGRSQARVRLARRLAINISVGPGACVPKPQVGWGRPSATLAFNGIGPPRESGSPLSRQLPVQSQVRGERRPPCAALTDLCPSLSRCSSGFSLFSWLGSESGVLRSAPFAAAWRTCGPSRDRRGHLLKSST